MKQDGYSTVRGAGERGSTFGPRSVRCGGARYWASVCRRFLCFVSFSPLEKEMKCRHAQWLIVTSKKLQGRPGDDLRRTTFRQKPNQDDLPAKTDKTAFQPQQHSNPNEISRTNRARETPHQTLTTISNDRSLIPSKPNL